MLRIGICDENSKDREHVRKVVTEALFQTEEITYIEYADGITLEQEIIKRGKLPCDLLLMEMEYTGTSGLQLATKIRDRNIDVDIIFVTNQMAYVYEGYRVQAQGYVLKNNMDRELSICLHQYTERRRQTGYVTVKSESTVRTIPIASILYIESNARMLMIHTRTEVIPVYGKLADMESQVRQYGFLRIHQSFLVKKTEIREITGNEVVVGENRLPVSRKYCKDVQEKLKPKKMVEIHWDSDDQTITRSVAKQTEDNGAVIGTKGELLGIIYRIKKGEYLKLGRDASVCQIVVKKPNVSREHCIIRRLENDTYEIEDLSKNGVYIEGERVGKGNKKIAGIGNRVWICDDSQEFRLG